jgi:hypothetical protein
MEDNSSIGGKIMRKTSRAVTKTSPLKKSVNNDNLVLEEGLCSPSKNVNSNKGKLLSKLLNIGNT